MEPKEIFEQLSPEHDPMHQTLEKFLSQPQPPQRVVPPPIKAEVVQEPPQEGLGTIVQDTTNDRRIEELKAELLALGAPLENISPPSIPTPPQLVVSATPEPIEDESPVEPVVPEPDLDVILSETPVIGGEQSIAPVVLEPETESEDSKICRGIQMWASPHSVAMVMKYLSEKAPEVFPSHTSWDHKLIKDPPQAVYEKIIEEGFVESILPSLKIQLTTSLLNISWSARVAIGMAIYAVVKDLSEVSQE